MTKIQISFIVAYGVLLLTCIALMVGSEYLGPTTRQQILPVATDGFKTVLGALIGALSLMLGARP